MEKKAVIRVKDLKKSFRLPHERNTSLKQAALGLFSKKSYSTFEVLKGVSFDVYEGDFFGIIGRNGCGKSTLLKMLAGIYVPDSGSINIDGKISPFLELGVGFNPELTGYENVYLNGAILGLSKKEVTEKMDEIIEFSELADFMDQKLKNYSSGMQVRLAFSVAIHAHAPIILLDEVLAVGDSNFQQKCFKVFQQLKIEGRTIVFVSHSMDSVKRFCNRAILLKSGQIIKEGDPELIADAYEALNMPTFATNHGNFSLVSQRGNKDVEIINFNFKPVKKENLPIYKEKEPFKIEINIKNNSSQSLPMVLGIGIYKDNQKVFYTNTKGSLNTRIGANEKKKLLFLINENNLLAGDYYVNLAVSGEELNVPYHALSRVGFFKIKSSTKSDTSGTTHLTHAWEESAK